MLSTSSAIGIPSRKVPIFGRLVRPALLFRHMDVAKAVAYVPEHTAPRRRAVALRKTCRRATSPEIFRFGGTLGYAAASKFRMLMTSQLVGGTDGNTSL